MCLGYSQQALAVDTLAREVSGQHRLMGSWVAVGQEHRSGPAKSQADRESGDPRRAASRRKNQNGHGSPSPVRITYDRQPLLGGEQSHERRLVRGYVNVENNRGAIGSVKLAHLPRDDRSTGVLIDEARIGSGWREGHEPDW